MAIAPRVTSDTVGIEVLHKVRVRANRCHWTVAAAVDDLPVAAAVAWATPEQNRTRASPMGRKTEGSMLFFIAEDNSLRGKSQMAGGKLGLCRCQQPSSVTGIP